MTVLERMLRGDVEEQLQYNHPVTITYSPPSSPREESILANLLSGNSIHGYVPQSRPANQSVLRALLTGNRVAGYEHVFHIPKRVIKPKRPFNVTTHIAKDPRAPPFPSSSTKAGPMPRTAKAAKDVDFEARCDNSWKECTGVKAKAAAMWDERNKGNKEGKPIKVDRKISTPPKYMTYLTSDRRPTNITPWTAPQKKVTAERNVPQMMEACTSADNATDARRVSHVTEDSVSGLRERARNLAAKFSCPQQTHKKHKTLQQRMGMRFVNAFKKENRGILWVHALDRRKESEMNESDSEDQSPYAQYGLSDSDTSDEE